LRHRDALSVGPIAGPGVARITSQA
jgi:hypothetical protein